MLTDIVVDTNVFVHAHNPEHAYCGDARRLALALLTPTNSTLLRVDPGFHPIEARNRSRIVGEYLQKLVPGMLGHHLIQELAAAGRLSPVEPIKDQNLRKAVQRLVSDTF